MISSFTLYHPKPITNLFYRELYVLILEFSYYQKKSDVVYKVYIVATYSRDLSLCIVHLICLIVNYQSL